ncbi:MAG: CaiB/BaiF CoA-transferase family protein [Chloroflexota bacterium]|jgi:crotonobetainyl-CoA:carnitine CoA-transferase CaiB-like acyl-CoA transferase|nr:CaiB/BaiF CoA-transferase family protein [Chloroflexota bacterium]
MSTGPLEGIKVIDLTRMAPGPFCTMMLGDMGASVTKVEAPPSSRISSFRKASEGEVARISAWNPLNRNKRSIILDLKMEEARLAFYEICKEADVVVEGFRPGVVDRLGCDYETINRINESIVYCSISGYGQTGPYKDLVGHDINYISIGGALGIIGSSDGTPSIPYNIIADFAAGGMNAAFSIVAALVARSSSGKGQSIDISMSDGVAYLLAASTGEYLRDGTVARPGKMTLNGGAPYYNVFRCLDGKYISIGCIETWFWENLCKAIGLETFGQVQFDQDKYEDIFQAMRSRFATRTREDWWMELSSLEDIAVAPVLDMSEMETDPHIKQRNMVVDAGIFDKEPVKQIGIGPKFSKTPGSIRSLGRMPGEDTFTVLSESGISKSDIEKLFQSGGAH